MALKASVDSSPSTGGSRNLRQRNLAVGVCVAFLAALFYAVAIVKLGGHSLLPP